MNSKPRLLNEANVLFGTIELPAATPLHIVQHGMLK
jgi:hypothetical protein